MMFWGNFALFFEKKKKVTQMRKIWLCGRLFRLEVLFSIRVYNSGSDFFFFQFNSEELKR